MSKSKPPKFLKDAELGQRLYNGRKLTVWKGKVETKSIEGWVENPRIELACKLLKGKLGNRDLTQDEVFEIMKGDSEVALKELRDDIIKNGLRESITLSFNGRLLDGNRRFFAVKYALESLAPMDPNRQDLELLPTFILMEGASDEDEEHVLVEENYSPSLKRKWPDYVTAQRILRDRDKGLDTDDLAKKYNWSKSKIKETLKINDLMEDFQALATTALDPEDEFGGGLGLTEEDAEICVYDNYQFFNEAQKSFYNQLRQDYEFQTVFYRWMHEGKFSSFPEVRIAHKAWADPEAKSIIMSSSPTAAKEAKATLDYNTRVIKGAEDANIKVKNFIKFLQELKAEDMKRMPQETREQLSEALDTVYKMSQAANE